VEVVESGGGVGTGYLLENNCTARMRIDEVSQVIDLVVNDAPEIVWFIVFSDRLAGKRSVRHDGRREGKIVE